MPNTYKIPSKRKTIRTVNINNGSLTYDVDKKGKGYWFRNGKYLTPYQLQNYRYYDEAIKGYRTLQEKPKFIVKTLDDPIKYKAETPVYDKAIQEIYNKANQIESNLNKKNEEQSFKANNKFITLRTKGKMNLATIPTNVLDSIAINAGRADTDIKTALGLVGKESTFGGFSIPLGTGDYIKVNKYSPHYLTNNHAYFVNAYRDYDYGLYKKYKDALENDTSRVKAEKNAEYALSHGLIVDRTPHYHENIMADAFMRYNTNPSKYNPGQDNYVPMVNNIGNEIFGDKAIKSWWSGEGIGYYNKGLNERRRLESRGTKSK